MRAFAGNATRMADTEGTAHSCIVDPNDSSKLSPVSINATTIEKANSNLLSGKDMIQNLGFTLKSYSGWKCTPMLYEPCIFKLEMRGITYIVIHTDDVDGVSEDPRDAKDICDAFHKEFNEMGKACRRLRLHH